jgi:hypothetical protein
VPVSGGAGADFSIGVGIANNRPVPQSATTTGRKPMWACTQNEANAAMNGITGQSRSLIDHAITTRAYKGNRPTNGFQRSIRTVGPCANPSSIPRSATRPAATRPPRRLAITTASRSDARFTISVPISAPTAPNTLVNGAST